MYIFTCECALRNVSIYMWMGTMKFAYLHVNGA